MTYGLRQIVPTSMGWLLGLLFLGLITGCGTTSPPRTSHTSSQVEHKLRQAVEEWWGTPHQMGGTTRQGADCSGFVMRIYDDLFNMQLPRSTDRQVRVGTPLERAQLDAGDLVLFRTGRKTKHVGIYLKDGKFAHVSSSQGVTISSMETPYWQRSYWTARRVLPTSSSTPPAASRPAPSTQNRGSW